MLKKLVEQAEGKLDILIAGGVDGNVIPKLYQETGSHTYHMYRESDFEQRNEVSKRRCKYGNCIYE